MKKTRIAKSFYSSRELPLPEAEYWPEDAAQLQELMVDQGAPERPRLLVGDGQHLRSGLLSKGKFDVVRTERCARILTLDMQSKLVRVEAGVRWRDLQDRLVERGVSLHAYALYPSTATLGGLLARSQPTYKEFHYRDLRDGCVALSTVAPSTTSYRYLPAPRKASGPDLRYLFLGGEGMLGAILTATLVVWKPTQGRLYRWNIKGVTAAVAKARSLFDMGVRPSWTHYDMGRNELAAAVHGPERLLGAIDRQLGMSMSEGLEISGDEDVQRRRRWLEDRHPDRRSAGAAPRTLAVTLSLTDAGLLEEVGGAEALEIHRFSAHTAVAYLTYPDVSALRAARAGLEERALIVRPIIDADTVTWPQWAQTLKTTLDARRRLAVGP